MFDIGFMELLLIAIIGLVVLGPERLPGAVRAAAYWLGKIRRSFQNAKDELEKELDVEGIRQQIHNEAIMKELEKTRASLNESLNTQSDTDKNKDKTASKSPVQDKSDKTP